MPDASQTPPPVVSAIFYRGCDGCGKLVPLDEWQSGPLGCDECRLAAQRDTTACAAPKVATPNYAAIGLDSAAACEGCN